MDTKTQHWIAAVLTLLVVALGLLSPMASSRQLTGSQDMATHLKIVYRESEAVALGQWPARLDIDTLDHEGYGYPLFQFYAPLFHAVSAALAGPPVAENAYDATRLAMLLMLVGGGVFMLLACRAVTGQFGASLLGALVFVSFPYVLVNIHARGALTEFMAQMVIPAVIWTTLELARTVSYPRFVAAVMAWLALILTHTITMVYFVVMFGLFIVISGWLQSRVVRPLAATVAPLAVAAGAAFWFLGPVVFYPVLIKTLLGPSGTDGWFSFLQVFAPVALPDPIYTTTAGLSPAVGLPALFVLVAALAGLASAATWRRHRATAACCAGAATVFLLALYLTKGASPLQSVLPPEVYIAQYPYRYLAHASWSAGLLAAGAAVILSRRGFDLRHALAGGVLCLLAAGSYLPSTYNTFNPRYAAMPEFGGRDYLPVAGRIGRPDDRERAFDAVRCALSGSRWSCPLSPGLAGRSVVLPVLFYPGLMTVAADGRAVPAVGVPVDGHLLVGLDVPEAGTREVSVRFTGAAPANAISLAVLGVLAAAGGMVAWRAARRRWFRTARAAAIAALVPLALATSPLWAPGSSPPSPRQVNLSAWSHAVTARMTPPAALPAGRWPLLSAGLGTRDRLVIFLETGGPLAPVRLGVDTLDGTVTYGQPFIPEVSGDAPVALEIAFATAGDGDRRRTGLTVAIAGAVRLRQDLPPLGSRLTADIRPGVNGFGGLSRVAAAFPGTLVLEAARFAGEPVVARPLIPVSLKPAWLFPL